MVDHDAPSPRVAVIIGEAGIGKTRLAAEVVVAARARGRMVFEGNANTIDRHLPLGAYRNALRTALRRDQMPHIDDSLGAMFPRWLLPELGDQSPGELDVVFEAAVRFFQAAARPSGALIMLDDLHLALQSTCALTAHLARALQEDPITIVVTFRDDEATVAVDALRSELHRARLATEIPLVPLPVAQVGQLLDAIVGATVTHEAIQAISASSAGNPFAIEEVVRECIAHGWLRPGDGGWSGPTSVPLPRSARGLLTSRVSDLTAFDRDVIQWMAVLGEPVALATLGEVLACDADPLRHAITRLIACGLLIDSGREVPGLHFRHSLGREAVLGDLSFVDRIARHTRVLTIMQSRDDADQMLETLLSHALASDDSVRGFDYSLRAARRARALGAHVEAAEHVERALRLWTPASGDGARAEALFEHGSVLSARGNTLRAVDLFDDAREAAIGSGRRDLAALALASSADARWDANRRTSVLRDLDRARAEAAQSRASDQVRAQISAGLARALLLSGDPLRATGVAREGLELVPSRLDPTRLGLRISLGAALIALGEVAAGRDELLAVVRETDGLGDPLPRLRALLKLASSPLDVPPERVAHARAAVALAHAKGLPAYEGRAYWVLASAHLAAGDWDEVDASADAAEACLSGADADPVAVMGVRVIRAARERRSGRAPDAIRLFGQIIADAAAHDIWEHELDARVGLARCLAAVGDLDAAEAAIAPALVRWGDAPGGPASSTARLLVTGVEIAVAVGNGAMAAALVERIAQRMPGPRASYSAALAQIAAGGAPQPGVLLDAVTHVEALGRRPEAARMAATAADALAGAGRTTDEAVTLAVRAIHLYDAMGTAAFRERAEGILRRLEHDAGASMPKLTARETEVLGLIAQGLTNRAIATQLVIGESTVARHVFNLFNKLGVHNRAQAAVIAIERQRGGDVVS
jgi:DNA-binding NarL/FixJ family response regulator